MREYMLSGRNQEAAPEDMARWEQLQLSISQWGDFYSVFDYAEEEVVSERLPQVSRWIRTSLNTAHFGPIIIWRLWNQSNVVDFSSSDSVLSDYDNLILGTRHFLPDSVSLLDLFRATLKAHMGVATVLSVVWWSRFPPDAVACRALSVLKLWAESPGIREIVRMLALVPVFYEALSELTVDVPLHNNSVGIGSWLALNELHTLGALVGRIGLDAEAGKLAVMLRVADRSISLLGVLLHDILRDNTAELLVRDPRALSTIVQCFEILVDNHATTSAAATLAAVLAPYATDEPRALRRLLTTALLRGCRTASPFASLLAIPALLVPHHTFTTRDMDLDVFGTDIALALTDVCVAWNEEVPSPAEVWETVVHILEWVTEYEDPASLYLHGLDPATLDQIRTLTLEHAPDRVSALDVSRAIIASSEEVPEDLRLATAVVSDMTPFTSTSADLRAATSRKQTQGSRESTPPPTRGPFDILALASLSPRAPTSPITPTAPLSLTKMYSQNEFRSV
ncbi:hypothetical protein FRC12_001064 [Ceratobasidium sp. 428]|nr:hypothetical protein FRC12_001064 [Ceratobasidium sp. 428]